MYSKKLVSIIGFHGCDLSVRDALVNGKSQFKPSENNYDWLGHGMYFWENDFERALEFAKFKRNLENPTINNPSVVGVLIDLGICMDFTNSSFIPLLSVGYKLLLENIEKSGRLLQKNKPFKSGKDLIFRDLDCAVIETLHKYFSSKFDSVRGVFWEGESPYENAGFRDKNHIQICIRNPNCIKGYFIPRITDINHREIS